MQNYHNRLYREEEREMIPQCIDQGVAVVPWSPLARRTPAGTRTREGERRTTRANADPFGDSLYLGRRAGQATYGWPDSLIMERPAACQPIMPSDTLCAGQPAPASARAA